ncbi:hypothetical protein Droror1_Dr00026517 [Drosera rotundifolia]
MCHICLTIAAVFHESTAWIPIPPSWEGAKTSRAVSLRNSSSNSSTTTTKKNHHSTLRHQQPRNDDDGGGDGREGEEQQTGGKEGEGEGEEGNGDVVVVEFWIRKWEDKTRS